MSDKSAFYDPAREKARYHGLLVLPPPPAVHMVAYVTGGLQTLYNNIYKKECRTSQDIEAKLGSYTNEQGFFTPHVGMPLLAGRYKYIATVGTGQSSVIIKAVDTFRGDVLVAIKVLHLACFLIGSQEANIMLELSQDDPLMSIPFVRLQNIFHFEDHYCLTFELLDPNPVTAWFKALTFPKNTIIDLIAIVSTKLVNVLCFLNYKNIIHADLKPDNILIKADKDIMDVKVVDFGNAIHCVHDELSLYYSDYELQTLSYRAPEVLLGVQVGPQVDVWSLGCILAELYIGEPLFSGQNKKEVLQKIVSLLGPLPKEFQNGKYATQYEEYFGKSFTKLKINQNLHEALNFCEDWIYIDFLSQLLSLNPSERLNPIAAQNHQFLVSSLTSYSLSLLKDDDLPSQMNELELVYHGDIKSLGAQNTEKIEVEKSNLEQTRHSLEIPPLSSIVPINHETIFVPGKITIMQSRKNLKLRNSCQVFISIHLFTFIRKERYIKSHFKWLLIESFPFFKEWIIFLLKDKTTNGNLEGIQHFPKSTYCIKLTRSCSFTKKNGKIFPSPTVNFCCLLEDCRKNYSPNRNLMKKQICFSHLMKANFSNFQVVKKKMVAQPFGSIQKYKNTKTFITVICCGKLLKSVEKCKRCLSSLESKKK